MSFYGYLKGKKRITRNENYLKTCPLFIIIMTQPTITIPKREYVRLKKKEKVDKGLLKDIAHGIKDILKGKVKEV